MFSPHYDRRRRRRSMLPVRSMGRTAAVRQLGCSFFQEAKVNHLPADPTVQQPPCTTSTATTSSSSTKWGTLGIATSLVRAFVMQFREIAHINEVGGTMEIEGPLKLMI